MIDVHKLRKNTEIVAQQLAKRGYELDVSTFSQLEFYRKSMQSQLEALQSRLNLASQEIGKAKQQGLDIEVLLQNVSGLSSQVKHFEEENTKAQTKMDEFLWSIPNLPDDTVPVGTCEADNKEVLRVGQLPQFSYPILDHVSLCAKAMSFSQGISVAKSRFVVMHGALSRLNRVLGQWMLDTHTSRGYHEVNVPLLVNKDAMFGTSQLPKFADEQYYLPEDDLYLIPTAEVSVTNIHREQILPYDELPKKYVAYSACFRREAGSYGKDTRGLIRQHQFEKVELVQWVMPDVSVIAHESLTLDAEYLLQALELPYRKMLLCTGDMGFGSCKTYDLEVWLPSQNCYREISSCSLFGDFQSRRMKTRVRNADGKIEFPYTINGSGLAIGRTLVAILENYQQENGDILIPKVLIPYMGGMERLLACDLV